ncbi:helix-turn-helix domain-containing protein [Mycobacterium heidelbergense]|uniref:helix-turn-helix domain-containing protein n=1 Tax=Mycobacterium heidelbergense TaxID=53376 RepID=UPI003CF6D7C8
MDSPSAAAQWNVTDDLDRFSEMLRNSYLPFAVTGIDDGRERFSASVREHPLGQLRLVDGVTFPHGGIRTARQVGVTSRDVVGLHFLTAGREFICQGDEVLALGPGDLMVWDSDFAGTYEVTETAHKRTLVLPRMLAAALLPGFHLPGTVRMLPGRHRAPAKPLFDLLAVLSDSLATMSPLATTKAVALIVQMLADLGGTVLPDVGRRRVGDLRERVLWYVEQNLGDPALNPATVAAAHYVSLRTLYNALETLDVPLAAHIRSRRLARCYADLVSTNDPVGDIATRWGFVSFPHFSRAFTKQYGISPSRLR